MENPEKSDFCKEDNIIKFLWIYYRGTLPDKKKPSNTNLNDLLKATGYTDTIPQDTKNLRNTLFNHVNTRCKFLYKDMNHKKLLEIFENTKNT